MGRYMRLTMVGLYVFFVMAVVSTATYIRGMEDGVERYRHSKQFYLTLYAMYHFGLIDGCTNDALCDRAGLGGGAK
jgi:hypothetical protein